MEISFQGVEFSSGNLLKIPKKLQGTFIDFRRNKKGQIGTIFDSWVGNSYHVTND